MEMLSRAVEPHLSTPFPKTLAIWTDKVTGYKIPKGEYRNLKWRSDLLKRAEEDRGFRDDLWTACSESLLLWVNAFAWTYHQFDVSDGRRHGSDHADVPMITWEVQDDMLQQFLHNLESGEDILVNKSREMGASWLCIDFLHWLWLFRPDSQLLELSRTEQYVDQSGNMKALFQKHDYINQWLPDWMVPPECLPGGKNRTKMHMYNIWNRSCIDGESTTEHAASGDRRLVILLDEFAKVKHGRLMRSATRDAGLMRIVNSTVAGPGTEYSKWKNSGQIKVFSLMWWEHPEKGRGRYCQQNPLDGGWKIRSPWYDNEETVRSPVEMAREIDAEDVEAGDLFFSIANVDKHIALFAAEPKARYKIDFKPGTANDVIGDLIRQRSVETVTCHQHSAGPLRVWTNLVNGRPDQSMTYIFGIDISKGQGASNSVISVKCRETKMKIMEFRDANIPPYEFARIAVALALWVGGRTKLPFLKWENNGPGWDFGRYIVRKWFYPFYYRARRPGKTADKKTKSYGWQSGRREKEELLREYDRVLAHGGYINPSRFALEEARQYVYMPDGSIGPAALIEEDASARKTHGDCVIADALTVEDTDSPRNGEKVDEMEVPEKSCGFRRQQLKHTMKQSKKLRRFDFSGVSETLWEVPKRGR